MIKHLVVLTRILWWGYILEAFYGDRWWQLWWGKYSPYTQLQYLCLPNSFGQYYSQQWYHTHLIKNRAMCVYIHGSWCHIEIDLYFTPKHRTLQFFIKKQAYEDRVEYSMTLTKPFKTTWGRFFHTFTNRDTWWPGVLSARFSTTVYHPACNVCNEDACPNCKYYGKTEQEVL